MTREELLNIIRYAGESTILNLSGRDISALPPEIGNLTHLTRLNLKQNQLKELPKEIGKLVNLRELWLDGNQLTTLPAEIGNLKNLKWLSLGDNQLSEIPPELAHLSALEILNLQGNHALPLPRENLSRDPAGLIEYLLLEQEKRRINEIKVVVLGRCGAGKTSVIRRLWERTFDRFEKSTHGIHIQRWPFQIEHKRVLLNIWDFGRDEIENGIYRFFMTPRSLYLLVWDSREENHQAELENWLKLIQFLGQQSPLIVVINKTDLGIRELNRRQLLEKYPFIRSFINVSAKEGNGIHELRAVMRNVVAAHENTRARWQPGWLNVKTRLEISKQNFLEMNEFHRICDREGLDLPRRSELLGWLNDLGVVTHFSQDFRLSHLVILRPEWLANAVNQILNAPQQRENQGVLIASEIREILQQHQYPLAQHLFIIDLMKRYELCFDLEDNADTAYLFPRWMNDRPPRLNWEFHRSLLFRYQYNFLPKSLLAKLIARVYPFLLNNAMWQDGFILSDGKNGALVEMNVAQNTITIYVVGRRNTRRDFLARVRYSFDYLHELYARIEVQETIPLLDYPDISLDYHHLLRLEEKGEKTVFPEGVEEPLPIAQLLNGWDGSKKYLKERSRELIRQFERLNERIEKFWLDYARESDQRRISLIEQKIKKSEAERDELLDTLQQTRSELANL